MKNKTAKTVIIIATVLVVAMAVALVLAIRKTTNTQQEMQEMVEQINYEKESLEQEYADLALFEGQNYNIHNDSLLRLLDNEKARVQSLLEELHQTKATNARRIAELKKELASVRKVMVSYIAQVDSLNRINTHLVAENKEIKNLYTEATQTVETLTSEKEALTEQVKLASLIETRDITITPLNDRDKKTTNLRKIAVLRFDFTILKNITAPTGNKVVYLRITTPDERVLVKKRENLFAFEGSQIEFSCKKAFEYTGEEQHQTLYWTVEEVLLQGTYRVDIFIDGNLVGTKTFALG